MKSEAFERLETIYRSGKVRRYHVDPIMARTGQTNADHQWGVAAIILMLHPNPSPALLKAAIFHDAAELMVGDLPFPFKLDHPAIAAAHKEVERLAAKRMGLPDITLTSEEVKWLVFADRLESTMLVLLFEPSNAVSEKWRKNNSIAMTLATELGVDLSALPGVVLQAREQVH
jgi:5'-deoxynucleotidase